MTATEMSCVPNAWGCHDPQCGDSTWDHDCPTVPAPEPSRPLSADVAHHAEARFAVNSDGEVTDRCDAATWQPASAASLHEALHGEEPIGLPDWRGDVAAYLDRMPPARFAVDGPEPHEWEEALDHWAYLYGLCAVCGQPATHETHQVTDDAPDADPNEPRPADAGCCGGSCGR